MVVLAASICTKNGKAVLSRQFVDMSRSRIEGLLSTFPKLAASAQQHTLVETDSVRFVFQPVEQLYIVLTTTKTSNILQDIDTLQLVCRVVAEACRVQTEKEVSKQAFELLALFDEIISLGYRESVTLGQIRTISAMESHDERVQAEIEKNKEKEAKEEIKRKAKQIDMQKKEQARAQRLSGHGAASLGMSSGGGGYTSGSAAYPSNSYNSGGFGSASASYNAPVAAAPAPSYSNNINATPITAGSMAGKGMQLGSSKSKNNALFETIKAEEGITDLPQRTHSAPQPAAASHHAAASPVASPVAAVHQDGVHIVIEEKISASINREGGIQGTVELNGSLMLKINDPACTRVSVALRNAADSGTAFKTHPNVDKNAWASNGVIALKDPARPYPVNQPLGVLRWRGASTNESSLPLSVTCWPSPSGNGSCSVNIEYELLANAITLVNTTIVIPYPGSVPPTVRDAEGDYVVDKAKRCILWTLPLIDASSASGVLEFTIPSEDTAAFFPIHISFTSDRTLTPISVGVATLLDSGAQTAVSVETSLIAENYQIV